MNQADCNHNPFSEIAQCPCFWSHQEWVYPDNVFVRSQQYSGGKGSQNSTCERRYSKFYNLRKTSDSGLSRVQSTMEDSSLNSSIDNSKDSDLNHDKQQNQEEKKVSESTPNKEVSQSIQDQIKPIIPSDTEESTNSKKTLTNKSDFQTKKPNCLQRRDVEFKTSFRKIKKYFKNMFKRQNKLLVRRRYINCSLQAIERGFLNTLSLIMDGEAITMDLVHFCAGITCTIKVSEIPCSQTVRDEISNFISVTQRFSNRKLEIALRTKNVRILCKHFLQYENEGSCQRLREKFDRIKMT